MADLILRLRVDPATGKRELVIDYTSDADALPIEHEDAHRQLADKLVDGGLRSGKVEVTREAAAPVAEAPAAGEAPVAQPTASRR
ncbi:MAG TPA: hypothetical protein VFT22_19360 [Kofleriaceae bacterium]|nr:hypothetical protein [Kofleriaceae bacterium]